MYFLRSSVLVMALAPAIPLAQSPQTQYYGPIQSGVVTVNADTVLKVPEGIRNSNALDQIVAIGRENRLPLGVVMPDRVLCESRLKFDGQTLSVQNFADEVSRQIPNYHAVLSGDAVNIESRNLPEENQRLLNIEIDKFTADTGTHQRTGVGLWMYIRAVVVPEEGTGFAGGSSTDAERLNGMHVEHETVRQILNQIARKGHGALWVMGKLVPDWEHKSVTLPYSLYAYTDRYSGISNLSCPAK